MVGVSLGEGVVCLVGSVVNLLELYAGATVPVVCTVDNACEPEGLSNCLDNCAVGCYAEGYLVNACLNCKVAAFGPSAALALNLDLALAVPGVSDLIVYLKLCSLGDVKKEGEVLLGVVSGHLEIIAKLPVLNEGTTEIHLVSLCERLSLLNKLICNGVICGMIGISGVDDLVNAVLTLCKEYVPSPIFLIELVVTLEDYNAVRILNGSELLISSGVSTVVISVNAVSVLNAGNVTDTNLTVISSAVADLECIACIHENLDLVYVSGSVLGLGHNEVLHRIVVIPAALLHITGTCTDEVVGLFILYEYVTGVLSEDIGILVNSGVKIECLGKGCFSKPTGEVLTFDRCGSPGGYLGALVDLFFLKKFRALIPANCYLVAVIFVGLLGGVLVTKEVTTCKHGKGKCKYHYACNCQ